MNKIVGDAEINSRKVSVFKNDGDPAEDEEEEDESEESQIAD